MTVTPTSARPGPGGPAAARRSPGRTAALAALVFLAVVAVRGRLPEERPADTGPAGSSPLTTAGILLLLSVSMLITAVALLTRPPRRKAPAAGEERRFPGGSGVWSLRRLLVLATGAAMAVLLAVLLRGLLPQSTVPGLSRPPEPHPSPAAQPPAPASRPDRPVQADDDVFGPLAATVIAMTVLLVISAVIARRRDTRPGDPADPGQPPARPSAGPEPLVTAAERGLAAVEDLSLGPREAIIACYLAMEDALADAPEAAPRASDTPSEVLARAESNRTLRSGGAARLVGVFAEARFSTHTMTEHHREVAEQALRSVLDELRGGG